MMMRISSTRWIGVLTLTPRDRRGSRKEQGKRLPEDLMNKNNGKYQYDKWVYNLTNNDLDTQTFQHLRSR